MHLKIKERTIEASEVNLYGSNPSQNKVLKGANLDKLRFLEDLLLFLFFADFTVLNLQL
jgi:hypothetical protein